MAGWKRKEDVVLQTIIIVSLLKGAATTCNYESCFGYPDYTLVTQGTAFTSTQTLPSLRFSDSDIMLWNKVIEKIINRFGKFFKYRDELFSGWRETCPWGRLCQKSVRDWVLVLWAMPVNTRVKAEKATSKLLQRPPLNFPIPQPCSVCICLLNNWSRR